MTKAARVLVTGAGGFVGSAVARALVQRGERVRVTLRATSQRDHLAALDLDVREADLRDRRQVAEAMRGIERLYHVAADYRLWAPDPNEIVENNVSMTRTVMEAAQAAGVERIVYTSSVATLAPGSIDRPGDEAGALTEAQAIGAYKRSKVAAERVVEAMAEAGLPAVIVNPSAPIGPYDVKPTPTGRIIVEALMGRMPAYVDTGLNLVHVDDVAAGHLLAMEKGEIGRRYILGGQNESLGGLLAAIASRAGRPPPRICLPTWSIMPVAAAAEGVARFTRKEPFVTLDGVRMARKRMYFTAARAEQELGFTARPFGEALDDAIVWFRSNGYLR
ncbi:MAG: NAD-dependent epimerase/dehydratase family protein [Hyphomicrobiales bacterium]